MLTPILLTLGWPPLPSGFLLLIGFVPLLMLEQRSSGYFLLKTYLSLLLWNTGTTWWVWNASPEGCIAMLLANSLLMSLTFVVYRRIKKYYGIMVGQIAWVISWLAFEYLHLNWEITFPWLNLGNGMATLPMLVQWYEYTGVLGGTLWILTVNVLLYNWIRTRSIRLQLVCTGSTLVPVLLSLVIWVFRADSSHKDLHKAVVVQPNIDPYQKFDRMDPVSEVAYFKTQSEPHLDSTVEFLLFPETAITENCEEEYINQTSSFTILKQWLQKYPGLTLITGTNTYRFFDAEHKTTSSRKHYSGKYYDVFNSSVSVNAGGVQDIYRKSKLVPGVEKMPYTRFLGFLEHYAIDLGGIQGSLGADSFARVFLSRQQTGAAPLICYESVYGAHTSDFVDKNAHVLFVLSNDGWWGNTPGYRQHKYYAALRAIEMRRDVIRCTNTGTSCYIDSRGSISGETRWWQTEVKTYTFHKHEERTFYSKYGDYTGIAASWLFGLVLVMFAGAKAIPSKFFS